MHQLWYISSDASALVHQLWCISSCALSLEHQLWCIGFGASALVHQLWCTSSCALGTSAKQKKRFNSGIARIVGGVTLARIFLRPFLLKEKVSSMVATAERVGKVARIGGCGAFG